MIKIIFLLLIMTFAGCPGYSSTGGPGKNVTPELISKSSNAETLVSINSLLVAPVETDPEEAERIPSAINLDEILSDVLNQELQLKIVHATPSKGVKTAPSFLADARRMNLDGVLFTKVNSFSSRQGSAIGSTSPASVGITMRMVRVSDGLIVWQSNYHFKDQALSDNLFRIEQRLAGDRPKFRSAEELIWTGYRQAIKDFSGKRMAGFIGR